MEERRSPLWELKRRYAWVFGICLVLSVIGHAVTLWLSKEFKVEAYESIREQVVIQMEDIPETRQVKKPPPPPRPAVPIATESEDLADDVTIESTDLDFDEIPQDIAPPPPLPEVMGEPPEEEAEIVPFYHVEIPPEPIKSSLVAPEYPDIARKAGMEGQVFLQLLVGTDGKVEQIKVLKGPEIFREAAVTAAKLFRFKPARQNDKPVRVWVSQVIRFDLE